MTSTTTPDSPAAAPGPEAPKRGKEKKAKSGTLARVLGIAGIIFAFIPHVSGFGIFLGVVAIILGVIGLRRKKERALSGIILGAAALILGMIFNGVYASGSPSTAEPAAASKADSATAASSPAAAAAAKPSAPSAPEAPKAPAGTAAQLQALAAAQTYLASGMGFSQASLTDQLSSSAGNGFPLADAKWAVAHSGADWNDQGLKAAKGYLTSGMGFSQASLTDQLSSSAGNKFTEAQAKFAVAHSGADWNDQAVKAAKGYMSSGMGFSRQSLIEQLSSPAGNKFTAAQAAYAAGQVGLK